MKLKMTQPVISNTLTTRTSCLIVDTYIAREREKKNIHDKLISEREEENTNKSNKTHKGTLQYEKGHIRTNYRSLF